MAKEKETKKTTKEYLHEVVVKIDGERWQKAIDEAFAKKQKTVKVDGFRAGKVPKNVYEKNFGKESLYLDAADALVQVAYVEALKDSKLIPVVQPSVDIKSIDENGVEFKFTIITKPTVKIKKYKGLKVEKEKVTVKKEEIEEEVKKLLTKYEELAVKKEGSKVAKGDIAIIDFEGFKDGVAFDGGKGENYSLEIGSNTFIPGFEDALVGMKQGEEKDIELTFPENYGAKDLAGAKVVFKVKVNEIKEKVARKLDEEFFEDLGMKDVTDEKTLKEEIKKNLTAQKEQAAEYKYEERLLEEVAKNVEVDIPEELVDDEIHEMIHRFEHQLSHQGLTLEMYHQFTNTTHEDLHNQFEKEAYKNVLYRLMLEEIKNLEKIDITDEELDKEIEKVAKDFQTTKEDLLKEYNGKEIFKYDFLMHKTINRLKELNK